jgi:hypothetical protein
VKGIPFASKKLALETAFDLQSPCCDFSKSLGVGGTTRPRRLENQMRSERERRHIARAPISRERRCNEFHIVCRLGRYRIEAVDVCEQDHRVWKKNQQDPDGSNSFLDVKSGSRSSLN